MEMIYITYTVRKEKRLPPEPFLVLGYYSSCIPKKLCNTLPNFLTGT